MNEEFPIPDFDTGKQTSSAKLIKNSRGYGWEIKIYDDDIDEIMKKTQVLNEQFKARFKDEE